MCIWSFRSYARYWGALAQLQSHLNLHFQVYYRPFRKNFYVETAEQAKLTKKDVDDYREELDIRVRGKNCPKPVRSWAQCGVEWKILNTLKKLVLLLIAS